MSRKHLVVALMALGANAPALAGGLVATLAAPTLQQKQVLDGTLWRCVDNTCRSASEPTNTAVAACKDLAKKFGQVVNFTSNDKPLDAEQLARCNEAAK